MLIINPGNTEIQNVEFQNAIVLKTIFVNILIETFSIRKQFCRQGLCYKLQVILFPDNSRINSSNY